MFAVMVRCRTGTTRLVGGAWESVYHTITWSAEEDEATAQEEARKLKDGNPREVMSAYVRPWEERFACA